MSILEAMAAGKPIVAPRVGGIPEIVTHGREGFLADRRETAEFVRYGIQLLSDRALRDALGQNAKRTVVADFSAAAMAEKYAALYLGKR